MHTVFRWVKAFKAGKFFVEDDTHPGRPKTSVTKANIAAVKIVVEQDARLSVKDIASCTGISEGSMQTILKKRLDLRKVCARWVPHLLTEEQKTQRLKCAQELLKTVLSAILSAFVRLFGLCLFGFVSFLFLMGSGKGCCL